MNPYAQVGKSLANWNPCFANWTMLANTCQLHSHTNQGLSSKLAKLAVGNAANLPTELSHCFDSISTVCEVGEISPLPTGEVDTPDWESGCLPRSRACHLDCGRGAQAEVTL